MGFNGDLNIPRIWRANLQEPLCLGFSCGGSCAYSFQPSEIRFEQAPLYFEVHPSWQLDNDLYAVCICIYIYIYIHIYIHTYQWVYPIHWGSAAMVVSAYHWLLYGGFKPFHILFKSTGILVIQTGLAWCWRYLGGINKKNVKDPISQMLVIRGYQYYIIVYNTYISVYIYTHVYSWI